jgi:flavodoxin
VTVLIVSESYFGNTRTVAQAITSGLAHELGPDAVTVLRPGGAPHELPPELDLLLVGAPTHEFSMPKAQSRRQAAEKGATDGDTVGVREWLQKITPRGDLRVLTFDTSIRMKFMPGSASKAAFKSLKKRGFRMAERGQSFYVADTAGPLVDGEEQRAEAWGRQLADSLSG